MAVNEQHTEVGEPTPSRSWIIVLAVISIGFVAYAATRRNFEADIAFAAGYYLFIAIAAAVFFCFAFKPPRGYRWLVFAGIYGGLIAGHAVHMNRQAQTQTMFSELKASVNDFAEQAGATDPNAVPQPIEIRPVVAKSTGDMGVAELFSKTYLNEMAALRNEYLQALENAGWMTLLDANRIADDPTFARSREILAAGKATIATFEARQLKLIASMPQRARTLKFSSEAARRDFAAGVERGTQKGLANAKTILGYEYDSFAEVTAIIDLLERNAGSFEVQGGQLVFAAQETLDAYNLRLARIDEILKLQAEASQNALDQANATLDRAATQ